MSEITKRSITEEAVPFVFLILMKDINTPGLDTSEGAEYTFGILSTMIREFTPMEFVQLIEKTTCRLNMNFCNGFGTYRDPQKVYASTFTDFIDLSRDDIPPVMDGSVEIDPNGSPFVDQLWGAVGEVIYYTSIIIEPLFNTDGFTAEEQSPFYHHSVASSRLPPICGMNSLRIYQEPFLLVTLVALLNQPTQMMRLVMVLPPLLNQL